MDAETIIESYFENFNGNKWLVFQKGLGVSAIKKNKETIRVNSLDELINKLLELKPEDKAYIEIEGSQCFFPLNYYTAFKDPSEGFVTYAPTMNIPKRKRSERKTIGSPQEAIIDSQRKYVEKHYKHFSNYDILRTRGFKWYKSNNHVVLAENHIMRGWMLFSSMLKLMELKMFNLWYSTPKEENFYVKIPSTSTKNYTNDLYDVLTKQFVTPKKAIEDWVFFHGEVSDKGSIYRSKNSKYKIPEQYIDHRIVAAMLFRQFVVFANNNAFGFNKKNFLMGNHAKDKNVKIDVVIYNIIPVPSPETMSLFSALMNRVIVKSEKKSRKLRIREIESVFSAMNKKRIMNGEDVYMEDNLYKRLGFYTRTILYENLKWFQ